MPSKDPRTETPYSKYPTPKTPQTLHTSDFLSPRQQSQASSHQKTPTPFWLNPRQTPALLQSSPTAESLPTKQATLLAQLLPMKALPGLNSGTLGGPIHTTPSPTPTPGFDA